VRAVVDGLGHFAAFSVRECAGAHRKDPSPQSCARLTFRDTSAFPPA
jgi:hypothetical protein